MAKMMMIALALTAMAAAAAAQDLCIREGKRTAVRTSIGTLHPRPSLSGRR